MGKLKEMLFQFYQKIINPTWLLPIVYVVSKNEVRIKNLCVKRHRWSFSGGTHLQPSVFTQRSEKQNKKTTQQVSVSC